MPEESTKFAIIDGYDLAANTARTLSRHYDTEVLVAGTVEELRQLLRENPDLKYFFVDAAILDKREDEGTILPAANIASNVDLILEHRPDAQVWSIAFSLTRDTADQIHDKITGNIDKYQIGETIKRILEEIKSRAKKTS